MNTGDIPSESLCLSQARGSQLGQFCPQCHLEMSGDILVATPGVEGCQWHLMVKARDVADHHAMHSTVPMTQNNMATKVNRAVFGILCSVGAAING